jgi:copper(I)-binding protein
MVFICGLPFGCTRNSDEALAISNVRVFAPLPGRSASVAYMDIRNQSRLPINLNAVSSPDFARAELHETTISDGIARMQPLGSVAIAPGATVSFAPGGKHIMLIDPLKGLLPGASVRLELHYGDGALLLLTAPLQTRMEGAN